MTSPNPNNLDLWNSLSKTDPSHTKSFTRGGGFSGTAIKPMWAVWRATKEFGPVGIGWGWDVVETQIAEGMVFCLVRVWYVHGGLRYETGAQWGGTEIRTPRKDGSSRADDESFKKSVTDGITKCLSYIGIGGDVHLGQFDDTKYVSETKAEFEVESKTSQVGKQRRMDESFVMGAIAALKGAKTSDELMALGRIHAPRVKEIRERSPELLDDYAATGREMKEKFSSASKEAA